MALILDFVLDRAGPFSLGAGTIGLLLGISYSSKIKRDQEQITKSCINILLPIAIVLLGFGLDIERISNDEVGLVGLIAILTSIFTAFASTFMISKILGIEKPQAFALGAGGAICGTSAVLAVAPTLNLSNKQTGAIVAVVNFLGLLTFLSIPLLSRGLSMDIDAAGIWAGATVHAVPQAVAAGEALGSEAMSLASGTKLTRVIGLLIVVPAATLFSKGTSTKPGKLGLGVPNIPLFLPGFMLASMVATFILPSELSNNLEMIGGIIMVPVLVLIGVGIRPNELINLSRSVLLAGLFSTLFVMVSTYTALAILI